MEDEDYDYCYECKAYGNDWGVDENGEPTCRCDDCIYNDLYWEEEY